MSKKNGESQKGNVTEMSNACWLYQFPLCIAKMYLEEERVLMLLWKAGEEGAGPWLWDKGRLDYSWSVWRERVA